MLYRTHAKFDLHTSSLIGLATKWPGPLKANSHRHARHDKAVLSVSRPLWRCALDSRQLKTCRRQKIRSLSAFRAIVQFTPAHRTWHYDTVVSGVRCELIGHYKTCSESFKHDRFVAGVQCVRSLLEPSGTTLAMRRIETLLPCKTVGMRACKRLSV